MEAEKHFDIKELSSDIQDLYINARSEYKEIIEGIFNPQDGIEVNTGDRPLPPYAPGTLDKPFLAGGMPVHSKPRKLVLAILSGNYRFIEIEGGKRGGKDIYGLFGWGKYLMNCPDRLHLALGTSLEHVLRTVLMSNGFGLYFLIPHGIFVRETINGAQRGVYKFLDNYGIEKQILFYGNEKENDKEKFQGFTLGSIYVNEALNQHINGILEGDDRIASSRQPLIITTQNPKGESSAFYQSIEKPRLTTLENIKEMEYVRDNYKTKFHELRNRLIKDRDIEKKKIIKNYLNKFMVSKITDLPNNYQILLNESLLNVNYEFDKIIRNYTVEDFATDYIFQSDFERNDYERYKTRLAELKEELVKTESFDIELRINELNENFYKNYGNRYLLHKSMQSICEFERGGDNPNHIYNAYNFFYSHFNCDDNLYMTEMQRNNYKNSRSKGTASYDQDIIGIRRSAEGAIYDTFTNANIFGGDIKDFDWLGKLRAIVIDPGFNHPTGITDWAVDLNIGKVWCLQERLVDFKFEHIGEKSLDTIYYEFLKIVRGAKNRADPEFVIIDPSKPELIEYIQKYGFSVYEANNQNWTTDRKDKEISEQITSRELRGIPLVQTAFSKLKIMIHESCVNLISQIGTYSYVDTDKSGDDKLPKLNDDLVVTVKYLVNTMGIRPSMWENDERRNEDGEKQDDTRGFQGNESPQNGFRNLEQQIAGLWPQLQSSEDFFGDEDDGFFSSRTDIFS